jgi:hypothetical protein
VETVTQEVGPGVYAPGPFLIETEKPRSPRPRCYLTLGFSIRVNHDGMEQNDG